jgi:hypothetical protein
MAKPVMAHLPSDAGPCRCRRRLCRATRACSRPLLADEAVMIAAGEGSPPVQGQSSARLCRHHTPPS